MTGGVLPPTYNRINQYGTSILEEKFKIMENYCDDTKNKLLVQLYESWMFAFIKTILFNVQDKVGGPKSGT